MSGVLAALGVVPATKAASDISVFLPEMPTKGPQNPLAPPEQDDGLSDIVYNISPAETPFCRRVAGK